MALQTGDRSDEIGQAVNTAHYLANTFAPQKAKEEILPYDNQRDAVEEKVSTNLAKREHQLHLIIKDNGKNSRAASLSGQGLDNVQHRAELINGKVSISKNEDSYEVQLVAPIR